MTITLKTWTNPATNQQRVYLTGVIGQRGAKVWVEQQAADCFGSDWSVQARAEWACDLRKVRDEAADAIEKQFGRKCQFAQIAAAA